MLAASSQLLLRQFERLQQLSSGRLLLVNPPADDLALKLQHSGTNSLKILSNDYSIYQALKARNKAAKLNIQFGYGKNTPATEPAIEAVIESAQKEPRKNQLGILFMPREKPFLKYALAQTIRQIGTVGKIWLVGENRSGIKSAGKHLEQILGNSNKLDSARHCTLLESNLGDIDTLQFGTALKQAQSFSLIFGQQQFQFTTLPGVFSAGRLDPATAMLLESLETSAVSGNILDFACGAGVIGLCLSQHNKVKHLDLIDVNAMAIESARINLVLNRINPEKVLIQASDAYSTLSKRYDVILSNPPFHRHSRQTLEVSETLIIQAPEYLTARGELRIVANRHLPYLKLFKNNFKEIKVLQSDRHFHVIQGKYPQQPSSNRT